MKLNSKTKTLWTSINLSVKCCCCCGCCVVWLTELAVKSIGTWTHTQLCFMSPQACCDCQVLRTVMSCGCLFMAPVQDVCGIWGSKCRPEQYLLCDKWYKWSSHWVTSKPDVYVTVCMSTASATGVRRWHHQSVTYFGFRSIKRICFRRDSTIIFTKQVDVKENRMSTRMMIINQVN